MAFRSYALTQALEDPAQHLEERTRADVDECEDLDTLLDDLLTEYESTDKMQAQVDAQEIYYA